uniref:Uncharacterized protein n=1 Tax=Oryza glumipatula TaxID=40148 RepID=A0A0D9ZKG3_9ORYZ
MTYLATSQSFQFPMIDCSRNRRVTRGVIADGGRTAAWSSRSDSEPYLDVAWLDIFKVPIGV